MKVKGLLFVISFIIIVNSFGMIQADAANVITRYSFDNTEGMTDPGFGELPSITVDNEKGKVLQFADGEASEYVTDYGNRDGDFMCTVVGGSSSTYEIKNPYAGGSYMSMTYSFWVKATDPEASTLGAGILGWISPEYYEDHPDVRSGEKLQEYIGWRDVGNYIFGTNIAQSDIMAVAELPMLNFGDIYHNWYCYWNGDINLADGNWHHVMVTTDSSCANTKVYIDGVDVFTKGGYSDLGKRYNHGEKDSTNIANTLEPTLMEIICNPETKLYLGQTGTSPTMSSVYIDDVTFYDSIITDEEAAAIYNEDLKLFTLPGDVNNDGNVNAKDALLVLKHAAKIAVLGDAEVSVADATCDGNADVADALWILKQAAKVE